MGRKLPMAIPASRKKHFLSQQEFTGTIDWIDRLG
jgi:hypothetical protein